VGFGLRTLAGDGPGLAIKKVRLPVVPLLSTGKLFAVRGLGGNDWSAGSRNGNRAESRGFRNEFERYFAAHAPLGAHNALLLRTGRPTLIVLSLSAQRLRCQSTAQAANA